LPATRRLKEIVFREADLFLAVTERTKEVLILEGAPADRIAVQMPGIDLEHFHPQPKDRELLQQFGCSEEDLIVLFVANLYTEKGVFDLLYAFKSILRKGGTTVPVKLLLGGSGREEHRLRKAVSQLQIQNHVRFIGSHPYSRMPAIHNLADIFVLPSQPARRWQEQFGYVLVESMACGKPVVSTQSGSIPEVVGDAGSLLPPNDYLALARTIENLLRSRELRAELGGRGRRRAEHLFDVRQVALQFRSHYLNLLNPSVQHA
jgi:glycosyltransferase involved in cell wall biosynthesis